MDSHTLLRGGGLVSFYICGVLSKFPFVRIVGTIYYNNVFRVSEVMRAH